MNPSKKRKLGRTDIELTQFGLGASSLGETFELVNEEGLACDFASNLDA